MLRRLNRKSRISSDSSAGYTPEPKYAVQAEEEKRRSSASSSSAHEKISRKPSSGEIIDQVDDETFMTLEEIKLKRKVSVSQSGKVHKKSSRNSIVDVFADTNQAPSSPPPHQWDNSEGSRQPRTTYALQQ